MKAILATALQWFLARIGVYPCIGGPLEGKYRAVLPDGYHLRFPYGDDAHRWPAWLWYGFK